MNRNKEGLNYLRFTWEDSCEDCPKCGGRRRKLVDSSINWRRGILTEKSRCSRCRHTYVSTVAGGKLFRGELGPGIPSRPAP